MALVHTIKGLIERQRLEVRHIITDEDNAHVIATEWLLDGEIVRRDVAVSILAGHAVAGEQAALG